MKPKHYSLNYISEQFITHHVEFKHLYIITHELLPKLTDDFIGIEIERALSITTLVTIIDQNFIFLNNYFLLSVCKRQVIQNIDKQVSCIYCNSNESVEFNRLETIFYELINLLNRSIRSHEHLNYYDAHHDLMDGLSVEQCQHLFNLNAYTITLFCRHMNIHVKTYDNARDESKKSKNNV